mgnify:CR=1 FL=1
MHLPAQALAEEHKQFVQDVTGKLDAAEQKRASDVETLRGEISGVERKAQESSTQLETALTARIDVRTHLSVFVFSAHNHACFHSVSLSLLPRHTGCR